VQAIGRAADGSGDGNLTRASVHRI
jgi:hypothetical protein